VELAKQINWPAFHAHSAYLGAALELGLFGTFLWAGIAILATFTAFKRFRATDDAGYGFLLGVGAFVLIFSGTETMFFMMEGLVLILLPGVALLAMDDGAEKSI
jgi:O-antigen ligase